MEFFQPWHLILLLIVFGLMAGVAYAVIRVLLALARKIERS
jgi:F0F1-type ATP synthase assembly protein I